MAEVVLRRVTNAIEANAIVAYLASQSCPAFVKRREIVAYPGVAEPPGNFAEILVADEHLETARALLDVYDASSLDADELESQAMAAPLPRPTEERQSKGWRSLLVGLAFVLSLGFNVFAAYALFFENPPNEIPTYDADGNVVALAFFHDHADMPYRSDTFDADGALILRAYDRDEDGWAERISVPLPENESGLTHMVYFDTDEDGRPERASAFQERVQRARFDDVDEDGLYETSIDRRHDVVLEDTDHDGVFDTFRCGANAPSTEPIHLTRELCSQPAR